MKNFLVATFQLLTFWVPGLRARRQAKALQTIGDAFTRSVEGCGSMAMARIRLHVKRAENVQQLWLLRSEVFQAVSQTFGEAEAKRRVDLLVPLFDGLLPRNRR